MKQGFLLTLLLFFSFAVNGAKPIEINMDKIIYTLSMDTLTASVSGADEDIIIASIKDSLIYENQTIPVTLINRAAFAAHHNLKNIHIPETVSDIEEKAFFNCSNLQSVNLPSSISRIRPETFSYTPLDSINIPSSVSVIEKDAFWYCGLRKIIFNGPIKEIGESAFFSLLWSGGECRLKEVFITSLEDWLNMKFMSTQSNPLYQGRAALFVDNKLVEDLIIPDDITNIGDYSFTGCSSIKMIKTGNNLETIGKWAFSDCNNIESIELGEAIKNIEGASFSSCPNLTTVKIHSVEPPSLNYTYTLFGDKRSPFYESYPEYMTLHVPEGTKQIYENTDGWNEFGTIIDDLPNNSRIEDVRINESLPIHIYNLNGDCVFSGHEKYSLPKGIYIMKQGCDIKKILIQ